MKYIVRFLSTCLFCLLLTSCPAPFDLDKLSVLKDLEPPEITINTPLPGSKFESTVILAGTIRDRDNTGEARAGAAAEFIDYVGYDIMDENPEITSITLDENGAFAFNIATAAYDNQITVVIYATDVNGNTAEISITIVPDTDGPCVVVTSPGDYSEYATVIELAGQVTNSAGDTSTSEVDPEISYAMPGTNIFGTLPLDSGTGEFYSTIDVSALDGSRTIEITASDLNGNTTTAVITIVKPEGGGDISGYTVVPGNGQVVISWDPVPFAESYSVFESNYYGESRDDLTSPYTWDGLENGETYAFQLTAHMQIGYGSDAVSQEVEKMPLSPRDLAPMIMDAGYNTISIQWRDNPLVSKYTVERALSPGGPWEVRRHTIYTDFSDTSVSRDNEYYYRVYPSAFSEIASEYCFAAPGFFPGANEYINSITPTTGQAKKLVIHDDYAYVCVWSDGVAIIDISDPANPGEPVYIDIGEGPAYDRFAGGLFVKDDYVYIAYTGGGTDPEGLCVVNVSNPANPGEPVHEALDAGYLGANDVWVEGRYAYLATDYGLVVMDVLNPADPEFYNQLETTDDALGIMVSGSYAYLACDDDGLATVNISNPADLQGPYYEPTYDSALDVFVYEDYAYVADDYGYLSILYVVNPANPGTALQVNTARQVHDVVVYDDTAYVTNTVDGIAVIDVSTPTSPGTPYYHDTPVYAMGIDASGSFVVVGDNDGGVAVLDISRPGTGGASSYRNTTDATDVALSDSYAYVAAGYNIGIIDIGSPASPGSAQLFSAVNYSNNLVIQDHFLYVSSNTGLEIYDIENPTAPVPEGSVATDGTAQGITVAGPYAFVAASGEGVAVIDVADPSNPVVTQYIDTNGNAVDVSMYKDCLYVADGNQGLAIIDISDLDSPGTPVYVSFSYVCAVDVAGSHAYVCRGSDGITIIDISDPESPVTRATVDTDGYAYGITVVGSYAYVADSSEGIAVIDVSNASSPGTPSYITSPVNAMNIAVRGTWAYVTDSVGDTNNGLRVIDLLDN